MRMRGLRHGRLIGIGMVVLSVGLAACATSGSAPQLGAIDSALNAGPERDSSDYVPPQGSEADEVAAAALDLVEGRAPKVPRGYTVTAQKDVDLLAEEAVDGRTRGWGLFAVRRDSPSTVVVEVPHPRSDLLTEDIGAEVFDCDAGACPPGGGCPSIGQRRARRTWRTSRIRSSRTWTGPSCNPAGRCCSCMASPRHPTISTPRPSCPARRRPPGPSSRRSPKPSRGTGITACVYDGALVPGPRRHSEHAGSPCPRGGRQFRAPRARRHGAQGPCATR